MDLSPRAECYRCARPLAQCVCGRMVPVENRTGVIVLQHAAERRHAKGTARLLRAGLARMTLHELWEGPEGWSAPVALPAGCGLLYPSADAVDLGALGDAPPPRHLVVLDGTWNQVHRLYRDNAWIRALPHYRLNPDAPSRYRIRKEPRAECLSSVEAVAAALALLEPDLEGLDALGASFDRMIDDQLAAAASAPVQGRAALRPRPLRPRPRLWDVPDARVVVVYAEALGSRPSGRTLDDLVQLTAVSLDGRRRLDMLAPAALTLDDHDLGPLELPPRTDLDPRPLDEVVDAFLDLSGPSPVLMAWNLATYRLLEQIPVPGARRIFLKGAWANVVRARVGDLGDVVAGLGLSPPPLPVRGRAASRLAWALAMARHLADAGEQA